MSKPKAYTKEWYEQKLEYQRKWNQENPEYQKKYAKEWRKNNPDKMRAISRRLWLAKFNLTEEQYLQLFITQDNRCAICNTHKDDLNRGLHIDHDHVSGKVRGLLCMNCNTALGKLNDNIVLFERAVTYLKV
jgi:hypothetical protein